MVAEDAHDAVLRRTEHLRHLSAPSENSYFVP
jgi:hypothetical protein